MRREILGVRHSVLIGMVVFIGVLCAAMLGLTYKQTQMLRQQEYANASAVFDLIVLARSWNAHYGGVYVEKTAGVESNPYLKNPDMRTASGKIYTLRNPAQMTRELSTLAMHEHGFSFHITSLQLLNPANAPDPWETDALLSFEKGKREKVETTAMGGARVYRLMRPLYVEASCLTCHAEQGYTLGDVRGGVSVTLPSGPLLDLLKRNTVSMFVLLTLLIVIFVAILYVFILRLMLRLREQASELEELNKTKDQFLGMAAHDLRTPLSIAYGAASALNEELEDESQRTLAKMIVQSSKRMLALIDDLLDVSMIDRGSLELNIQDVNVAVLAREAVANCRLLGLGKGVDIREDLPGELPARVDGDRLRQVFDNLICNAMKFSPPKGLVTVGAKREVDRLLLWVENQGAGIRKEELSSVFGEYVKGSSRPTAGESSHGLGLAIVKKLVELHRGTVKVESEPGVSTRFTVELPAA